MDISGVLELFGEMVKFILSQFTGLFQQLTADPVLFAIILIVVALGLCGTVVGVLRKFGLRSRSGKRKRR